MRKQVYSLLVDNTPGVLSRIAGLFSRRGFSIDSITAGVTADSRFTRITVVASGDERILSQIESRYASWKMFWRSSFSMMRRRFTGS